ncbi:Putative drug/metabolite transporter [Nitrosotalea devaniterrae]|uniref:Drug/metabolite transporter n=2 Tax=cellular organisms TaxID=131567 RepID=A0A128A268_9ARCH|nr:Putative drug/metabolite transporter [Candidatus Nitrosotalea devanaterra]
MNKKEIIGYLSALLASVLFGAVPTIAKPIISNINVLLLSSIAYLIAALVFTPISKKSKILLSKKDYVILVAISVCGAAAAPYLYFVGLHQSSATDTSLLSNVEIMFTVLFGLLFFKERLKPIGFVSVALVLLGVVIITTNIKFSGSILQLNAGHFFILGAMALWALDNNLSRIISTKMDTARLVQLKSAIGGSILLGTILVLQIPLVISTEQIPYVILLSAIGFGGSLYFFLQSLKRIGTIRTIMIFSMSSVFGLVFASVFLHEQVSLYQISAIAIMLTGIYTINRKESIKENQESPMH